MSSAHNSSDTLHAPYQIIVAQTLSEPEQQSIVSLLRLLPTDCIDNIQLNSNTADNMFTAAIQNTHVYIKSMVDGRSLACPMPLLKTKIALRNVAIGESLYIVATDPNSQADITAFCQHAQQQISTAKLSLIVNQTTHKNIQHDNDQLLALASSIVPFDTIYHFIITKTDSN